MVMLKLEEQPPLIQAIFSGDLDDVKNLLDTKLDVNYQDADKRSPLHAAAFKGDKILAELLLAQGARVNTKDCKWLTPLHRACGVGSEDTVALLLSHNADTTARDRQWQTPLHIAAANNAVECVSHLLHYVPNVNVTDRSGRTALHHAALNGHNDVVELLISKGCIVNACDKKDCRPIHWAAHLGHVDTMELLMRNGADIHVKDRNQYTPLHVAAASGMLFACRLLLHAGADVDAQNSFGNTPLHIACLNGYLPVCQELAMYNANLEAVNYRAQTPLHIAAASTHGGACLTYLLDQNVNINKQSLDGRTALHMSAIHGRFTRSKTLIDKGAIVDSQDKNGNTALHIAAQYGHDILTTTLLDYGADPNKRGYEGRTPLHSCCLSGFVEVSRKFIQINIDLNTTDDTGKTAVHCAAYKGSVECLDLLVSQGANFKLQDMYGRTPLHYASSQGHYTCVFTLVGIGAPVNVIDNEGCTPLHLAAAYDLEGRCVEYLLQHKADPKMKDVRGYTPVHYAVNGSNSNALDHLLEAVGKNYSFLEEGMPLNTPLHLAARRGDIKILNSVISYFPDVNIKNDVGCTPLLIAAREGHTHGVQMLLRYGAKVAICEDALNMSPVHYSAKNGHVHCLALLVDNTEDKNIIDKPDKFNRTALMLAISGSHIKCVLTLLKSEANPNIVDSDGHSSLFRAVVTNQNNVVQYLISKGACVTEPDINGKTVLHLAAACGHYVCLQTIMLHMPMEKASSLDNHDFSALHWGCYQGYYTCVEYLLQKSVFTKIEGNPFSPVHCAAYVGSERCLELLYNAFGAEIVKLTDTRKRTPLHIAALHGHTECARYLLEQGAEIESKDENGRTALIAASQNGQSQMLELLIAFKANVKSCDNNGNTALHMACLKKHSHTALLLLEYVNDVDTINMVNNDKKTPLHLSARNGLVEVTRNLIKKGSSVLAVDSNGLTPALCCAPNPSVAQCLAIILANHPMQFPIANHSTKVHDQPTRTRSSLTQTEMSLQRDPSELFEMIVQKIKPECLKKFLRQHRCRKAQLVYSSPNLNSNSRNGKKDIVLIEKYGREDKFDNTYKEPKGMGLHRSSSEISLHFENDVIVYKTPSTKPDRLRNKSSDKINLKDNSIDFKKLYKQIKGNNLRENKNHADVGDNCKKNKVDLSKLNNLDKLKELEDYNNKLINKFMDECNNNVMNKCIDFDDLMIMANALKRSKGAIPKRRKITMSSEMAELIQFQNSIRTDFIVANCSVPQKQSDQEEGEDQPSTSSQSSSSSPPPARGVEKHEEAFKIVMDKPKLKNSACEVNPSVDKGKVFCRGDNGLWNLREGDISDNAPLISDITPGSDALGYDSGLTDYNSPGEVARKKMCSCQYVCEKCVLKNRFDTEDDNYNSFPAEQQNQNESQNHSEDNYKPMTAAEIAAFLRDDTPHLFPTKKKSDDVWPKVTVDFDRIVMPSDLDQASTIALKTASDTSGNLIKTMASGSIIETVASNSDNNIKTNSNSGQAVRTIASNLINNFNNLINPNVSAKNIINLFGSGSNNTMKTVDDGSNNLVNTVGSDSYNIMQTAILSSINSTITPTSDSNNSAATPTSNSNNSATTPTSNSNNSTTTPTSNSNNCTTPTSNSNNSTTPTSNSNLSNQTVSNSRNLVQTVASEYNKIAKPPANICDSLKKVANVESNNLTKLVASSYNNLLGTGSTRSNNLLSTSNILLNTVGSPNNLLNTVGSQSNNLLIAGGSCSNNLLNNSTNALTTSYAKLFNPICSGSNKLINPSASLTETVANNYGNLLNRTASDSNNLKKPMASNQKPDAQEMNFCKTSSSDLSFTNSLLIFCNEEEKSHVSCDTLNELPDRDLKVEQKNILDESGGKWSREKSKELLEATLKQMNICVNEKAPEDLCSDFPIVQDKMKQMQNNSIPRCVLQKDQNANSNINDEIYLYNCNQNFNDQLNPNACLNISDHHGYNADEKSVDNCDQTSYPQMDDYWNQNACSMIDRDEAQQIDANNIFGNQNQNSKTKLPENASVVLNIKNKTLFLRNSVEEKIPKNILENDSFALNSEPTISEIYNSTVSRVESTHNILFNPVESDYTPSAPNDVSPNVGQPSSANSDNVIETVVEVQKEDKQGNETILDPVKEVLALEELPNKIESNNLNKDAVNQEKECDDEAKTCSQDQENKTINNYQEHVNTTQHQNSNQEELEHEITYEQSQGKKDEHEAILNPVQCETKIEETELECEVTYNPVHRIDIEHKTFCNPLQGNNNHIKEQEYEISVQEREQIDTVKNHIHHNNYVQGHADNLNLNSVQTAKGEHELNVTEHAHEMILNPAQREEHRCGFSENYFHTQEFEVILNSMQEKVQEQNVLLKPVQINEYEPAIVVNHVQEQIAHEGQNQDDLTFNHIHGQACEHETIHNNAEYQHGLSDNYVQGEKHQHYHHHCQNHEHKTNVSSGLIADHHHHCHHHEQHEMIVDPIQGEEHLHHYHHHCKQHDHEASAQEHHHHCNAHPMIVNPDQTTEPEKVEEEENEIIVYQLQEVETKASLKVVYSSHELLENEEEDKIIILNTNNNKENISGRNNEEMFQISKKDLSKLNNEAQQDIEESLLTEMSIIKDNIDKETLQKESEEILQTDINNIAENQSAHLTILQSPKISSEEQNSEWHLKEFNSPEEHCKTSFIIKTISPVEDQKKAGTEDSINVQSNWNSFAKNVQILNEITSADNVPSLINISNSSRIKQDNCEGVIEEINSTNIQQNDEGNIINSKSTDSIRSKRGSIKNFGSNEANVKDNKINLTKSEGCTSQVNISNVAKKEDANVLTANAHLEGIESNLKEPTTNSTLNENSAKLNLGTLNFTETKNKYLDYKLKQKSLNIDIAEDNNAFEIKDDYINLQIKMICKNETKRFTKNNEIVDINCSSQSLIENIDVENETAHVNNNVYVISSNQDDVTDLKNTQEERIKETHLDIKNEDDSINEQWNNGAYSLQARQSEQLSDVNNEVCSLENKEDNVDNNIETISLLSSISREMKNNLQRSSTILTDIKKTIENNDINDEDEIMYRIDDIQSLMAHTKAALLGVNRTIDNSISETKQQNKSSNNDLQFEKSNTVNLNLGVKDTNNVPSRDAKNSKGICNELINSESAAPSNGNLSSTLSIGKMACASASLIVDDDNSPSGKNLQGSVSSVAENILDVNTLPEQLNTKTNQKLDYASILHDANEAELNRTTSSSDNHVKFNVTTKQSNDNSLNVTTEPSSDNESDYDSVASSVHSNSILKNNNFEQDSNFQQSHLDNIKNIRLDSIYENMLLVDEFINFEQNNLNQVDSTSKNTVRFLEPENSEDIFENRDRFDNEICEPMIVEPLPLEADEFENTDTSEHPETQIRFQTSQGASSCQIMDQINEEEEVLSTGSDVQNEQLCDSNSTCFMNVSNNPQLCENENQSTIDSTLSSLETFDNESNAGPPEITISDSSPTEWVLFPNSTIASNIPNINDEQINEEEPIGSMRRRSEPANIGANSDFVEKGRKNIPGRKSDAQDLVSRRNSKQEERKRSGSKGGIKMRMRKSEDGRCTIC